jgi:uncharacterized membrane protein YeiH/ABC-type nitrate/sulfonate/bicarbonate transport system substrate-binding protein
LRLQLQWFHQAQFAGFYVAEALGYYEREGLAVEFIEGGSLVAEAPAVDTLQNLALGGADVAIATVSSALMARRGGAQVVNIGQILQRPGLGLACRRAGGIRRPADVRGRKIGVWQGGDQYDVRYWLRRHAIAESEVAIVTQRPDARDLIDGAIDCGTVMAYNEPWTLFNAGLSPADLFIVRFDEQEGGVLEDGLYVRSNMLADPVWRARLAGFLRASAAGWRYAQESPGDAHAVTMLRASRADPVHQRRMLETVLRLVDPQRRFGLLDLGAFKRSTRIVGFGTGDPAGVTAAARTGWTHAVWLEAGLDMRPRQDLTPAILHYLKEAVESPWFYAVGLFGTVAFALSGFMQAVRRRYDIWGAFILALLPPAGGGILRDLLVGGDRHPPFIFKDPTYIGLIFAVVLFGVGIARFLSDRAPQSRIFTRAMIVFDTIGFSAFTIVGAMVPLMSGLGWYWIPFCAGLTCAGGGMLLDIVTGREPRTFQGELYEEIAVAGGLLLFVMLLIADRHEHAEWLVTAAVVATMLAVFVARLLVVRYGIRSYRFGMHRRSRAA